MSEKILLYLPLDPYLRQWFINEHGGETPVKLQRGSVESKILEVYLMKRPDSIPPDLDGDGKVPIVIPEFRNRPPEIYNHLPKFALSSLQNIIRNRFDISLWKDLHDFGKITKRQDNLIYAWMESHGIEINETNWNVIAKRYQRQRNVYLSRDRSKKKYLLKKNI